MFNLNLNIDHFATLRNARNSNEPNVISAALQAEIAGATGIVAHLRVDRRHVKDEDIRLLQQVITTKLNLEMSTDDEIVKIAQEVKPAVATLVPERPEELTTEGGLDVVKHLKHIKECVKKMHDVGTKVSLFIEPEQKQLEAAKEVNADIVELHTGNYAIAWENDNSRAIEEHIDKFANATQYAAENGLFVSAGHSLNYRNIKEICRVIDIEEYNIGHSIVARSTMVGVQAAVKEMIDLIIKYKTFYMASISGELV